MNLTTLSAIALDPASRSTIAVGTMPGNKEGLVAKPGDGKGRLESFVSLKVNDSKAPHHLLVTVTYGLFYQPEGWSYASFTFKFMGGKDGDLHYERVDGDGCELSSKDTWAKATPSIRFMDNFQVHFDCRAQYHGPSFDSGENHLASLFSQSTTTLCLKTS